MTLESFIAQVKAAAEDLRAAAWEAGRDGKGQYLDSVYGKLDRVLIAAAACWGASRAPSPPETPAPVHFLAAYASGVHVACDPTIKHGWTSDPLSVTCGECRKVVRWRCEQIPAPETPAPALSHSSPTAAPTLDRKRLERLVNTYGRAADKYGVSDLQTGPSRAALISAVMDAIAAPETPAPRETHPCEPCTSYSAPGRCLVFRTVTGDPRAVSGRCNAFTAPSPSPALRSEGTTGARCAGCSVRHPFEHRCHGAPCPCTDCDNHNFRPASPASAPRETPDPLRDAVEEEVRILSTKNRVSGVDVAERLRAVLARSAPPEAPASAPSPVESPGEEGAGDGGFRGAALHLAKAATGEVRHRYEGRCPDGVNGPASRDWECDVCHAIDIISDPLCASAAAESPSAPSPRSCLWHADCDAADRALRPGVAPSHPPYPLEKP